jgi:hypothetical protein
MFQRAHDLEMQYERFLLKRHLQDKELEELQQRRRYVYIYVCVLCVHVYVCMCVGLSPQFSF